MFFNQTRRITMHSNRILSITLCLALACVLLTGSALAGKTSATVQNFAQELAKLNQTYILPPTTDSEILNWLLY